MTQYRVCTRCVMDNSAADIIFDAEGCCNYCTDFKSRLSTFQPPDADTLKQRLDALVRRVRADGRGKRYDCIVGISGGADSAYALYLAKSAGLRPLAVHMDNGWNSELAVNNIENLVHKLEVDLYAQVVDWREYRALQQAFFDADVIDVELLYDNAMLAVNYRLAARYGIRYILAGTNTATEGMRMPPGWNWFKYDRRNILAIARSRRVSVKSLPTIGVLGYAWYRFFRNIKWLNFLDYVDYNKARCLDELQRDIGYRPYPYKHYESLFTRFYQGYLLPKKFGVDKRRLHFSSLICSGQMSRGDALALLKDSPYPDEDDLASDIDYFMKKMGWSQKELDDYLARPRREHLEYGSEFGMSRALRRLYERVNP